MHFYSFFNISFEDSKFCRLFPDIAEQIRKEIAENRSNEDRSAQETPNRYGQIVPRFKFCLIFGCLTKSFLLVYDFLKHFLKFYVVCRRDSFGLMHDFLLCTNALLFISHDFSVLLLVFFYIYSDGILIFISFLTNRSKNLCLSK